MKKIGKIFAGVATVLTLAGAGTATYMGIENNNLRQEHNQYVQESTLREEEAKQKFEDSEKAKDLLQKENEQLKEDLQYFEDNQLEYELDSSSYTAKVKGCFKRAKNIVIPEKINYEGNDYTVTELADYSFQYFDQLESVVIPPTVTSIGDSAFYCCSSLQSITIPASVTSIGTFVFNSCINLTTVTFAEGSQLESIGGFLFQSCNSLQSITIPAGVTSIGNSAFYACSYVSITFENTTGWKVTKDDEVIEIQSADLENPETAAKLVKQYDYGYTWTRS